MYIILTGGGIYRLLGRYTKYQLLSASGMGKASGYGVRELVLSLEQPRIYGSGAHSK